MAASSAWVVCLSTKRDDKNRLTIRDPKLDSGIGPNLAKKNPIAT
jgi:hypothetical protein